MLGYPWQVKEKEDSTRTYPSVYGAVLGVFFDYTELKDFVRKLNLVVNDIVADIPVEESARKHKLPIDMTKRALLLAGLYANIGKGQNYAVLKYANGQYDLIDQDLLFKDSFTMPVHA
jgi:hypothetical protein